MIEPHLPMANSTGRPSACRCTRSSAASFYVMRSGYPWCLLPSNLLLWGTVYRQSAKSRDEGRVERINTPWSCSTANGSDTCRSHVFDH